MLEKYVGIFRSQALFHVYIDPRNNIRRYKRYNYGNKKILYIIGKKYMSYNKPRNTHTYRFFSKLPPTIDYDEYSKKKLDAFRDLDKKVALSKSESLRMKQRTALSYLLKNEYQMGFEKQSRYLERCGCGISGVKLGVDVHNAIDNQTIKL